MPARRPTTNPSSADLRAALRNLRAALERLDACERHIVALVGPDTAPRFSIEHAKHDVMKARRNLVERTVGVTLPSRALPRLMSIDELLALPDEPHPEPHRGASPS